MDAAVNTEPVDVMHRCGHRQTYLFHMVRDAWLLCNKCNASWEEGRVKSGIRTPEDIHNCRCVTQPPISEAPANPFMLGSIAAAEPLPKVEEPEEEPSPFQIYVPSPIMLKMLAHAIEVGWLK